MPVTREEIEGTTQAGTAKVATQPSSATGTHKSRPGRQRQRRTEAKERKTKETQAQTDRAADSPTVLQLLPHARSSGRPPLYLCAHWRTVGLLDQRGCPIRPGPLFDALVLLDQQGCTFGPARLINDCIITRMEFCVVCCSRFVPSCATWAVCVAMSTRADGLGHCVQKNWNILEREIPTESAALESKQSSPPSQVNFIMNPLKPPFASSDVGDIEGTCVPLAPSACAGTIVGADVGALVRFGVARILTRIAHKPRSATQETSISTQEKDFFVDQHLCTRHVHEN